MRDTRRGAAEQAVSSCHKRLKCVPVAPFKVESRVGVDLTVDSLNMDCTVHSPCGHFLVSFTKCHNGAPHLRLHVQQKLSYASSNAEKWRGQMNEVAGISATSARPKERIFSAVLMEKDVVALTTAAGVRKTFEGFSEMLYNALIGRSDCVHFYVETVAEMKGRVDADVQSRRCAEGSGSGSRSTGRPSPGPGEENAAHKTCSDDARVSDVPGASIIHSALPVVRTAVGDTVIEMDGDVADEVLDQLFLTLDYDVDFTRALFPIPLAQEGSSDSGLRCSSSLDTQRFSSATSAARFEGDCNKMLNEELAAAQKKITALQAENDQIRRENAALVLLSKEKMQEMQKLCNDFQSRVHVAAEVDQLRSKNTELRVRLQEAVEAKESVLRTLDRERQQRQQRGSVRRQASPSIKIQSDDSSATVRHRRNINSTNPYLRSLSRNSGRSSSGGVRDRPSSPSCHRRSLDSPISPSPVAQRRQPRKVANRFDTPPRPQKEGCGASYEFSGGNRTVSSSGRHGGGGGDSPAPRGRTGGRLALAQNELRKSRSNPNCRSSSHLRREKYLWSGTGGDQGSACGSSTSSRCSSSSHDRLYRASTASSRQRQTDQQYVADQFAVRRAVFY